MRTNRLLAALGIASTGLALVLARPAEARQAECLVVMEGQSYIDGACEFEAEPNGDFTITLGRRSARVMVDPGAREGRAF